MITAIRFLPSSSFYFWIFRLSFLLSFSFSLPSDLYNVNINLCKNLCQCTSKTVDCNYQDALSFIPSEIREDFDQLHVSHAEFKDPRLTKANFSTIIHLTSLRIVYSKLRSIDSNTFTSMDRLVYMDLSHNNFSVIGSRAFVGLTLKNLYLEQNLGGLQLGQDMFFGLTVTDLYLKNNGISQISVGIIEKLQISKLYLFNNSIKTLDSRFELLFRSENSLLDLTQNPLDCYCDMNWFPGMVKRWRNVHSSVKLTCNSPSPLRSRLITELKKEDFFCETPSIKKISVDISDNYLQLVCQANGGNRPKISWKQINQQTGREIESAHFEDLKIFEHFSYVSLNVTKLEKENSFVCSTWSQTETKNNVIVKLKFNRNLFGIINDKRMSSSSNVDPPQDPKLSTNPQITTETHFLFRKQFSILQMIGAVVGTFTSVIVLIFIICCSQEHFMKKNSNSNPYWTIMPTEMKYASNRIVTKSPVSPSVVMATSVNSQDYDVPHYPETNTFLHNYYTERAAPHYVDVKPSSYFTTVT